MSFLFRVVAVAMIFGSGLSGSLASELEEAKQAYSDCWRKEAPSRLGSVATKLSSADSIALETMTLCLDESTKLEDIGGINEPIKVRSELAREMVERFDAETKASLKPFDKPTYRPTNPQILFNKDIAFVCSNPSEVNNAWQLAYTKRYELIEQIPGCQPIRENVEVEEIESFGDVMRIRKITANGKMITGYTSKKAFMSWSSWAFQACRAANPDVNFDICFDASRPSQ